MGVVVKQKKGTLAVISSKSGLLEADTLGSVCGSCKKYESPVTQEIAREFLKFINSGKTLDTGLLNAITSTKEHVQKFIQFKDEFWPTVASLWICGTYMYPMFQTYPYLRITSAEPGCGKSVLGQLISNLSFNGCFLTSPSEAQMFRLAESRGAQVWDEVELAGQSEKRRFEAIKAVTLSGYRNGPAVSRQQTDFDKSEKYHLFCPRAFIGLSRLPETASQRCIEVVMHKKQRGENVEMYKQSDQASTERTLKKQLILAALQSADRVKAQYDSKELRESVEEALNSCGRDADDVWLPLFSIAGAASDGKPHTQNMMAELARVAATLTKLRNSKPPENSDTKDSQDRQTVLKAIEVIQSNSPITPTELAEEVSLAGQVDWSGVALGRLLSQHGIHSEKKDGQRIFRASKSLKQTKSALEQQDGWTVGQMISAAPQPESEMVM
jgi:hypothetical protein